MTDDKQNYTKTGIEQAGDIVTRLQEQSQAPALAWLEDAADEIERLRAALDAIDARHVPDDLKWWCCEDGNDWPCRTHLLLHPEEASRG